MLSKSKSIFAKLLATENITVEHRKTNTAYFDTANRVMVLPIWKNMTIHLYDLLLSHEIGHALFTPAEGWHNNLKDKSKPGYKTFLNVVEDIRIEKKIQEKFPGLKPSFAKGYNDLMEQDFFGIKTYGYDLNALPFIDRINLHYKVGSFLNIQFSDNEKNYFKILDSLDTWEDVEKIVAELYELAKNEARNSSFDELLNDFDLEFSDDENEDSDLEDIEGSQGEGSEYDPSSLTDSNFRKRESEFISEDSREYLYMNAPTPNLKNIVVPYTRIREFYDSFVSPIDYDPGLRATCIETAKAKLYKKFLDTNKKYVAYLVKEFELKRNARQHARASVSKTGRLDLSKVYSYKYNDDLFKRTTIVPNGKSHGLIMFIDYSGSMIDNIKATIEQTIVLALFCRKVNIPFRVYAFTDFSGLDQAGGQKTVMKELNISHSSDIYKQKKFSSNANEIDFNCSSSRNFRLREYLSSEMSGKEFKEAIQYWLVVGELYTRNSWRTRYNEFELLNGFKNHSFETLNGTPLNETIVASIDMVNEFKRKYRLDIVNTVFLTDGESNETNYKLNSEGESTYLGNRYRLRDYNLVIRDVKTMSEGKKPHKAEITVAFLNLLRECTNTNIIGFFITPEGHSVKRILTNKLESSGIPITNIDDLLSSYKKNKFVMVNGTGYDDFYIIPGGDELSISEDEMDVVITDKTKKTDIKRAFLKMQKSKSVNRVLLSRFVEKIA